MPDGSDPLTIVILRNADGSTESLMRELAASGHRLSSVDEPSLLSYLKKNDCDVALMDVSAPDWIGLELIPLIRNQEVPPEIILFVPATATDIALEALRRGATDYLTKPFKLKELELRIAKAAEKRNLRIENTLMHSQLERTAVFPGIQTRNFRMQEVLKSVGKIAKSNSTVLITGESGTGKELIARAVHNQSFRKNHAFVDINCGAIPESLLESELFGYEKGAFTGAEASKAGLFELADKGTLFFDEVGELSPVLQVKLLRVLETHTFFRVGGTRKIRSDVRLITATNKDLALEMNQGKFRKDLYYRVNIVNLHLPPLRERPEDIPLLAQHFLEEFDMSKRKQLTEEALESLSRYSWPGNIRELRNALERAVLLSAGEAIYPSDLPINDAAGILMAEESSNASLDDLEKQHILAVLKEVEGHRGKAASILGISPRTLYRKLKAYGFEE